MSSNVKVVLSSICIGYSSDFIKSHFQHDVLLKDGQEVVMYQTMIKTDGGSILQGDLTRERPQVEKGSLLNQ